MKYFHFLPIPLLPFLQVRELACALSSFAPWYVFPRHPCAARIPRRRRTMRTAFNRIVLCSLLSQTVVDRHGGLDPPSPTPPRGNGWYCAIGSCCYQSVMLLLSVLCCLLLHRGMSIVVILAKRGSSAEDVCCFIFLSYKGSMSASGMVSCVWGGYRIEVS
jgi:hypothetical protein